MARNKQKRFKRRDSVSGAESEFAISPRAVRIAVFVFIVVALVAYLVSGIYNSDFFNITRIRSNIELTEEVKNVISGESLFDLDTKRVLSLIVGDHPEYKAVHVVKEFPSTVRIEVEKRTAVAQIKGERYYSIDAQGVILDEGTSRVQGGLVPIEIADYNRRLRRGQRIKDDRLQYALELVEALKTERILAEFSVKVINATALPVLYFIMDRAKIIIGKEDLKKRVYILKNLAQKQFQGDLSSVDYVDLRYNKVYVGHRR
ncbi:MAG: hypothetical protein JSW17_04820 [Candidatus Omnitrophota bacterium]|nr:MAG: hypothetical protein JSW17_04820 [Candidatus Omnitrophota bacterium]